MEPLLRTVNNIDWITVIIFLSVLFIVIAKGVFYSRFLYFIILPFNNKYIFMYNKKDRLLNWFHIFFTVFQLLNFTLFVFLAYGALGESEDPGNPATYFIILGLWLLFLVGKTLLQLGNGFVFNNGKLISEFIFKKLSYLNYSSLIMFLANVVLAYILRDSSAVVYVAVFLILLVNSIGWITIVKNHQKNIASYFFYFILYLCALEIAPLVIIVNYLID